MKGMAYPAINDAKFYSSVIALPPQGEQQRIVEKVDELMALCDRLEAQQQEREQQASKLARASLARFAATPTPANLSFLFHRAYDISPAELRKSILTLAVQGKLVPQDQQREQTGERGIAKAAYWSGQEEMPFDVPGTWKWERLGSIAQIERGGSPRPIQDYLTNDSNGLNWIKIGDTEKGGKYITSTRERIREEGLAKTRKVYPGDFLLTNSMSFGRPYITKIEGCIHDGWLRIHPPDQIEREYLYYLLSSPYVYEFFSKAAAGAVVQNLNVGKVRELVIPLPPLDEQHRIVDKVEQLMALVDELETQLADSRATGADLMKAVVTELTAMA
jgi:type I restriction enzyme S subunit